jgi:hypothetical protein
VTSHRLIWLVPSNQVSNFHHDQPRALVDNGGHHARGQACDGPGSRLGTWLRDEEAAGSNPATPTQEVPGQSPAGLWHVIAALARCPILGAIWEPPPGAAPGCCVTGVACTGTQTAIQSKVNPAHKGPGEYVYSLQRSEGADNFPHQPAGRRLPPAGSGSW